MGVENFAEIALSRTVKEKIFGKNSKIQNGQYPVGKLVFCHFWQIALSRILEANLCFAIFGKNSKIQNGRHFWGGENFLKITNSTMLRYPVGRNF